MTDRVDSDREPSRSEPSRRCEPPVLLAGRMDGGVAWIHAASGAILATAALRWPAVDVAHDPWTDLWLVAEYDDAGANQLSVWHADGVEPFRPVQVRAIETAGVCKLLPTPRGVLVLEDDGLQHRWILVDVRQGRVVSTATAPAPTDAVVGWENGSPYVLAVGTRDTVQGARAFAAQMDLGPGRLGVWMEQPLASELRGLGAVRLATMSSSGYVAAASRGAEIATTGLDAAGRSVSGVSVAAMGSGDSELAWFGAGPRGTIGAGAHFGSEELLVVSLDGHCTSHAVPLSAAISEAGTRGMSRVVASDANGARLWIASRSSLHAYVLVTSPRGCVERVCEQWALEGLRAPVANRHTTASACDSTSTAATDPCRADEGQ